jgi:hypothetical protein
MLRLKKWLAKRGFSSRPKESLKARFTSVYEKRSWLSEETASGFGSERSSGQVLHALDLLRRMIRDLDIRSIADVPCGDFNWMPILLEEHPEIDYVGYDIVPPLILENRRRHPERRFAVLDITREVPAQSDLIFMKDLLNHLYEKDVWTALENMSASRSRYFMVTNNTGETNVDIWSREPSMSRVLDLFAEPYSLPPAIYADHYIAVWDRDAVARRLSERRG